MFNGEEKFMTTFVQIHLLTSYPPACLNRDDLNRPKTAVMGGVQRLRISSQSLKRAWRTSEIFEEALSGHIGTRTKEMGLRVYERLKDRDVADRSAKEWTQKIASHFGKLKATSKENLLQDLEIEQLAHFSPEEIIAIDELVVTLALENRGATDNELQLLREKHRAADIALFGRMLADKPRYNTEAACQVAHALTVHKVAVEDDYFTAVDDLNTREEDVGSAHIGEQGFAAGLFYLYVCINRNLLKDDLSGDEALAQKTLRALTEAAATVAPGGKQNSFGSRAYASYILAEKGSRQPRSLSVAFLKPVREGDMLHDAIRALVSTRVNMDKVYYNGEASASKVLDALDGTGSLAELLDFVAQP
jgi:CRISPR system Cascade subunit CasC